ncbi:MAG: galactose oxidase [Bacteroidales bacterium]|nr:galactose oxidase [Bacteroidales bacterium]
MKIFRKDHIIISLVIIVLFVPLSCNDDDEEEEEDLIGNWVELSDFEGVPRTDAVGFAIGDKGYLGTGYDGSERLNDFWEYDVSRNTWMQKADFPGAARNGAVGFSTETNGYIGTGYDGSNKLKDFWKYDPVLNTWDSIADFGGSARYGAVGFSISNKGYVGTGYDGNYLKDIWEYDPINNLWTQKVSLGGGVGSTGNASKRKDAVAFVINGKGYLCNGIDNAIYENDFWEYDPETDTWTGKSDISDATDEDFDDDYTIIGINRVAFAINGKGYVATGGQGSAGSEVWEYDPVTDLWEKKTSFEGSGRIEAVSFSIGNRAYVTTGRNGSYYFDDIWAFDPDDEYNEYD